MDSSEIKRAFGKVLKQLRTQKGLTQDELAYKAGLARNYISLLEQCRRTPSLTTVILLAKALDVLPPELIQKTCLAMESPHD